MQVMQKVENEADHSTSAEDMNARNNTSNSPYDAVLY